MRNGRDSNPRASRPPAFKAGAIVRSKGEPRALLPDQQTKLVQGPRFESVLDRNERGTAPMSLQLVPSLCQEKLSIGEAVQRLTTRSSQSNYGRPVGEKEACAALLTAKHLGWVNF